MYMYLWFQILITIPQFVCDMTMFNSYEAIFNMKVYEYMIYARYRFNKRTRRWVHMEVNLDECIKEEFRKIDQCCFSSQFYFIQYLYSFGMMLVTFGIMIMDNSNYNVFTDPAFVPLIFVVLALFALVTYLCSWVADRTGFWVVKGDSNIWHSSMGEGTDALFAIPGQEDLLRLKKSSMSAAENAVMNQRMSSETFRHKFLDYNRLWLVEKLPLIFTPRTLRRSRPYLIAQLSKILGAVDTKLHDIDGGAGANVGDDFGLVDIDAAGKALMRWWLAQAQRRMRLRDSVAPLIARAKKPACEQCEGTAPPLVVELMLPVEAMGDRFDLENPTDDVFDVAKWKAYFLRFQRFRTVCATCVAARTAAGGKAATALEEAIKTKATTMTDSSLGGVDASAVAREIAGKWIAKARQRLRVYADAGPGAPRLDFATLELGAAADDADDELAARGRSGGGLPIHARLVELSSVSRHLAVRWLVDARTTLGLPEAERKAHRDARATRNAEPEEDAAAESADAS
jgi:hypothetical protein